MPAERPKPLEKPDFAALIEAVQAYVDFVESEEYHEDSASDERNYVFEAAVEAVYGPNIWPHINSETDRERNYEEE